MSEVKIAAPVPATLDPELREKAFAKMGGQVVDAVPGAYQIETRNSNKLLWFSCPCGCGDLRPIPLSGNGWTLTEESSPTVTPSIFTRISAEPHWHGFLTAGIWVQA